MTRPFPWPFARRKGHPPARAATIEMIYGMIVAQARLPDFYARFGVPDSVNGRFDMVLLHLWIVLRRMRTDEAVEEAQALFDHFVADMDANLREMGVGDFAVPKRMKKFGEAFYGRSSAYDAAIVAGTDELSAALARNVLATSNVDLAMPLTRYVRDAISSCEAADREALLAGSWRFPAPAT